MTVGEMIKELKKAPKDYDVFCDGDLDIEEVEIEDGTVIIWAS